MTLTREQLAELARISAATGDAEMTCEELLEQLASFVDVVQNDSASLPADLRAVARHLDVCAECREEFEMLIESRFPDEHDASVDDP